MIWYCLDNSKNKKNKDAKYSPKVYAICIYPILKKAQDLLKLQVFTQFFKKNPTKKLAEGRFPMRPVSISFLSSNCLPPKRIGGPAKSSLTLVN